MVLNWFITLCKLLQTTVAHRSVQQHHVLSVLLRIEKVVHVTQILLDGCIYASITLFLVILSGEYHLCAECLVNLSHSLFQVILKTQSLTKAIDVPTQIVRLSIVYTVNVLVLSKCERHAQHCNYG